MKKTYDFYAEDTHFARETMTPNEAQEYASKLQLRFEEVK